MNAAGLRCIADHHRAVHQMRLVGRLDLGTAPVLRAALAKAVADQPDLIVIDVAAMEVVDDLALLVFAVAARSAQAWPVTPLVLAAPAAEVLAALRHLGILAAVQVVSTVEQALAIQPTAVLPGRVHQWFDPVPGALAQVRALVAWVCLSWDIAEVSATAQLIMTELVANAVVHARTELRASLALRANHLLLSVRDKSIEPARLIGHGDEFATHGRGLIVVEALASTWGCAVDDRGKSVWAALHLPG